jgi:hypothetical protein
MHDRPEDSPTLGEQMNRGMYLDPGFTVDKPSLVDALRDDIDDTTKRAQANLDQQRANAADVDRIAKEMEREAKSAAAAAAAELADETKRGD